MLLPQAIFLDAVGTLIDIRTSVGQIYATFADRYNFPAEAKVLNASFRQAFARAPAPAFGVITDRTILQTQERTYWWGIVAQSFQLAYPDQPFPQFDSFFDAVFDYFSTACAWTLYPETRVTLENWQDQGITLGIISNFDSRLFSVLEALNLDQFFQSVTLSTQVGAAKPDPRIFRAALDVHGLSPDQSFHIGDSWHEDYLGAKAAALHCVWLNRDDAACPDPTLGSLAITRLDELF